MFFCTAVQVISNINSLFKSLALGEIMYTSDIQKHIMGVIGGNDSPSK